MGTITVSKDWGEGRRQLRRSARRSGVAKGFRVRPPGWRSAISAAALPTSSSRISMTTHGDIEQAQHSGPAAAGFDKRPWLRGLSDQRVLAAWMITSVTARRQ